MSELGSYRITVVPDNDAEAHGIPRDILKLLGPNDALMGLAMMYVRASLWKKIENRFTLKMPR